MRLSILIRNLNEATNLDRTLQAVSRQKTSFAYEVVVLDNASTDNSVEVASRYGCIVATMERSAFTYGKSLNQGIAHCKGDVVLLLSAHIILLNSDFLERIVACFDDEQVAFARPTNVSKGMLVEAAQHGPSFITIDQSTSAAQSAEQLKRHWWTLLIANCSAVKRSVAIEIPFNEAIEANEDKLWSQKVLSAGYKGTYNLPFYFYYSKATTAGQRLSIDYKELKTKAEILKEPYVKGNKVAFVLRSLLYACRMYWPRILHETKLAIRLAKLSNTAAKYGD